MNARFFDFGISFGKTVCFTIFFSLLLSNVVSNAQENDALNRTLSKVFQTVKSHSLYRKKVDWDKLEKRIFDDASKPLSSQDFIIKVETMFSSIGDRHASLSFRGQRIRGFELTKLRPSLVRELKTSPTSLHTKIIDNNYGYILIPSNSQKDNVKILGQAIQDSLCKLAQKTLEGLVIDLRANEGGSIYPIFTGLHQIIGNGDFGAFSSLDGIVKEPWKMKNGKFYQHKRVVSSVKSNCRFPNNIKVAVLLSQVTASAGEMLAIALRGRPHTIFIGEKTYGLTTGNVIFTIDGCQLALSASASEDRTGKMYIDSFEPDVYLIEGDDFRNPNQDAKVQESLKWFKMN